MAKKAFTKSGKTAKKIHTKSGMRTYWVGGNKKQQGGRLRNAGAQEQKPGFLKRHGGKLLLGTALVGAAVLNRHKLAGAFRGASLAHNARSHADSANGTKTGLAQRAHEMFGMAKMGYTSNRGMDKIDAHADRFKQGIHGRLEGARQWKQGMGADLTHHLASVGGEALASHVGSRFGQVAGTAVGGFVAGPAGAGLGGFIGGHAGNFLATRYGDKHIRSGAEYAAHRMRGLGHKETRERMRASREGA